MLPDWVNVHGNLGFSIDFPVPSRLEDYLLADKRDLDNIIRDIQLYKLVRDSLHHLSEGVDKVVRDLSCDSGTTWPV